MKRYMKNNKFDFFQSPHPRTKDFYNLIKDRDMCLPDKFDFFQSPHPRTKDFYNLIKDRDMCLPEDSENYDLHIFHTPLRPISFSPFSANLNNDLCSSEVTTNKKGYYTDFFQNIENQASEEQYQQSIKQINEKLQYSEELLIHLTPEKNSIIDEENFQTTAKKQSNANSSPNDVKFYQRGLKKLAFEAYSFVSSQKRTTYKEVAKRLINQINDDNELEIQRKGQMNIKRRVYDALNVLIALGLLKRNGNKIIGKKLDTDHISLENQIQKEKLKKKQQNLQQELTHVQRDYNKKIEYIQKKKKIFEQLQEKLSLIKNLTGRNKNERMKQNNSMRKEQKHIEMPFVYLSLNKHGRSLQDMMDIEQTESQLVISQDNTQAMRCKYSPNGHFQLIGDTDLLKNINFTSIQTSVTLDKSERVKKARTR